MEELKKLEIWCDAMTAVMEESLSHKYMSRRRAAMTRAEIMGVEKVKGQIRKRCREIESEAVE